MDKPDLKQIISKTLSEIKQATELKMVPLPKSLITKSNPPTMKLDKKRNYKFEIINDLFETSLYHVIISPKGAFIDQRVITVKAEGPFKAVEKAVIELERKQKKLE